MSRFEAIWRFLGDVFGSASGETGLGSASRSRVFLAATQQACRHVRRASGLLLVSCRGPKSRKRDTHSLRESPNFQLSVRVRRRSNLRTLPVIHPGLHVSCCVGRCVPVPIGLAAFFGVRTSILNYIGMFSSDVICTVSIRRVPISVAQQSN